MESSSPRKAERRIAPNVFFMDTLTERQKVFYDRIEAGKILAQWLQQDWKVASLPTRDGVHLDAVVFGIPSGGIPVAATIAKQLKLPLQVAVVSKILLPWNTEVGCGAVSFRQTKQLEEAITKVSRRTKAFGDPPTILVGEENKVVILVDDGLASGWTMTLAIEEFRKMGAKNIVVVVPTSSYDVILKIAEVADAVYCANIRHGSSFAVAAAYENCSHIAFLILE
ncbi:Putative phosphoribosyl transferase [Galdieria sulphuraria]|nr:Putative phosphoribosyl transferase [Galdieria sulphuraria]